LYEKRRVLAAQINGIAGRRDRRCGTTVETLMHEPTRRCVDVDDVFFVLRGDDDGGVPSRRVEVGARDLAAAREHQGASENRHGQGARIQRHPSPPFAKS
jgi:hypothetical protein